MFLPYTQSIGIYSITESVGTTGEVTESRTLLETLPGYLYANSARWGHREQGNASEGDSKAMLPLEANVNAGLVLECGGVYYRAVTVSRPGGHHTEVVCARM